VNHDRGKISSCCHAAYSLAFEILVATTNEKGEAPSDGPALTIYQRLLVGVGAIYLLIPILWVPMSWELPLGRDQGIFAWMGDVILRGGLPYADAWDIKGPGAGFLYALAIKLFGHSEAAIHVFDLVMLLVLAGAFYRLGRGVGGLGWAAVGFALAFSNHWLEFWYAAQPDAWAGVFLFIMTLLLTRPNPTPAPLALAGALLSLAVVIKPHYAIFLALVGLRFLIAPRPKRPLYLLGIFLVGLSFPILVVLGVYAMSGKLDSLWTTLIEFNLKVHLAGHEFYLGVFLRSIFAVLYRPFPQIVLACLGIRHLLKEHRVLALGLGTGALLSFFSVLLQNKFYFYHLIPFDIFVGALAGFGLWHSVVLLGRADQSSLQRIFRWVLVPVIALLLMIGFFKPADHVTIMWRHSFGFLSAAWKEISSLPDFNTDQIVQAALYTKSHTAPGDSIYVWGFDALPYFIADRHAPTRFGYNYPLLVSAPDYRREVRTELMNDLGRENPAMILVEKCDKNSLTAESSDAALADFPELAHLIQSHYAPVFQNPSFIVYRRLSG
jgi:hypothetical protein